MSNIEIIHAKKAYELKNKLKFRHNLNAFFERMGDKNATDI